MSRAMVVINSVEDRQRVSRWGNQAPWGTRVEFKQAKRSTEQNSKMWVLLTEVAQQLPYHGLKLTPDDWKLIFLDALKREVRMVPNLDGNGFVSLGRSSSDLSKVEMTDLIELIHEFGARHGVTFNDPADTADNGNTASQEPASEREGFDPSFVARETGAASTAILAETTEPSDVAAPSPDDGRDVDVPIGVAANTNPEAKATDDNAITTAATRSDGPGVASRPTVGGGTHGANISEGATAGETALNSATADRPETPAPEAQDGPDAAASPAELITRNLMVECMEKFLHVATDPKVPDPIDRRGNVVFAKNVWKDELKGRQDFVKACFETADKVVKGQKTAEDARTHLESLVA